MCRALFLSSLILLIPATANADKRRGPRLRIGRVEFGIPGLDSFLTVRGDRTTVKIFSRGDVTNVHTRGGTQVDVGIRSLFLPQRPQHTPGMAPETPNSGQAEVELGEPKPIAPTPGAVPNKGKQPGPELRPQPEPKQRVPRAAVESGPNSVLDDAKRANAKGKYQTAEELASRVLKKDKKNHAAYSIRAAALIGRGEQKRDQRLIQRGLKDALQAINLGKQSGKEDKRDYLVWFIGMNQLAALTRDRKAAASHAQMVDDYTMRHVDKFPDDLKEQVYHQQGFARLLLGKRASASESFRNAGKFSKRARRR